MGFLLFKTVYIFSPELKILLPQTLEYASMVHGSALKAASLDKLIHNAYHLMGKAL